MKLCIGAVLLSLSIGSWHRGASAAAEPAVVAAEAAPISGVFHAEPVPSSPKLTGSGLAWWGGRLIIADRGPKQFLAFTPPDKFEPLKTVTHPVGVAAGPDGSLVFTEKSPDALYRVARLDRDGREQTLVESKVDVKQAPDGVGTPHFVAVHPNGTIYWSGFPDGGTRYLLPGAKEVTIAKPRIVHTYGIGLSPSHDWLYVASKIPNPDRRGVWRFPVDRDGRLGEGELFVRVDQFTTTHLKDLPPAKDGSPSLLGWVGRLQGLAVDRLGYIYVGGAESHHSGSAVAAFSPDGKRLAAMVVGVPGNISGLAFGGDDGRTLFITGAGEYKLFQARLPVPGEVFRGPAGAGPVKPASAPAPAAVPPATPTNRGTDEYHKALNAQAAKGGIDLLFVGDSSTMAWKSDGRTIWDARYAPLKAANFGLGGDKTEHVLWRLQNGIRERRLRRRVQAGRPHHNERRTLTRKSL